MPLKGLSCISLNEAVSVIIELADLGENVTLSDKSTAESEMRLELSNILYFKRQSFISAKLCLFVDPFGTDETYVPSK